MFRIFEPSGIFLLPINWVSRFVVLFFIPVNYWFLSRYRVLFLKNFLRVLHVEFSSIFGKLIYPGRTFLMVSLFFYVLLNNFWGLFPYIFTSSRHGVFRLTISLPLWVGHIIWAFMFNLESSLAHFVPLRTPVALMPLMVIIEFVSRIIRPFTLAIRLAANIIAGHLLLGLLSEKMVGGTLLAIVLVLIGLLSLTTLELAVSVIQAYVFRLLSTLYVNEVNTKKFINYLINVFNIPDFLSGKKIFLLNIKYLKLFWK